MATDKTPEKKPAASKKVTQKKPTTKKATTKKVPAKKKAAKKVGRTKAPTDKEKETQSKASTAKKATPAKRSKESTLLKVQYYRSVIGFSKDQKLVVRGLGLRRLNAVKELEDTPAVRGMVRKVPHLVRVVDE